MRFCREGPCEVYLDIFLKITIKALVYNLKFQKIPRKLNYFTGQDVHTRENYEGTSVTLWLSMIDAEIIYSLSSNKNSNQHEYCFRIDTVFFHIYFSILCANICKFNFHSLEEWRRMLLVDIDWLIDRVKWIKVTP